MKSNKNILPNYSECRELCNYENSPFYEMIHQIDGFKISLFNYRLAQFNDFINPLEGRDLKALEMRGLCFVHGSNGEIFKRYLLLEKFFNMNQCSETLYDVVKEYEIKSVNVKEDGSIVSFIKLPNGRVIGKSKMGFDNFQVKSINHIYEKRSDVRNFVNWTLENDIVAIFEFVSPFNKIVVDYEKEDLILLRLRDNKSGENLNIEDFLDKIGSIKVASSINDYGDLDTLLSKVESENDKEGYVVHSINKVGADLFYKIKTPWYISLHGLLTNDLYRENILIQHILDDKIDDILPLVPESHKERIVSITILIRNWIKSKSDEIILEYKRFKSDFNGKKEYALKYNKTELFHLVMSYNNGFDINDILTEFLRKKTNRLEKARTFLESLGWSIFLEPEFEVED